MAGVKLLYHLSYRTSFSELYKEMGRLFADRYNLLKASVHTTEIFLYTWIAPATEVIEKDQTTGECPI